MDEYDFARRQAILATGDTVEEQLAAGADPDELMRLGLLEDDDDDYPLLDDDVEEDAEISAEGITGESTGGSTDIGDSDFEIHLAAPF